MKKTMKNAALPLTLLAASAVSASAATVTVPDVVDFNLSAWGTNAGLLAAPVAAAVALVKRRYAKLTGWYTLGLSFALAELGALGLHSVGLLSDPSVQMLRDPLNWIAFGFSAFLGASGGMAALKQGK